METIIFELDNNKNIRWSGNKIILNADNFPIKVKTKNKDCKEIKRVIDVRVKHGLIKIQIN